MRTTVILLALVLAAGSSLAQTSQTAKPRLAAGVVDGDTVWLDDFSREVGRRAQLNQLGGERSPSDVIEDAWRSAVRSILTRKRAEAMGIVVTKRNIDSLLLNEPPTFVREGFVDDNGKFDAALLRAMMSNPDSLVAARAGNASAASIAEQQQQMRLSMAGLYSQLGAQMLIQRLGQRVKAEAPIDSAKLYQAYLNAATTANADVIYMPCKDFPPDPEYDVLEAYFDQHSADYTSERELRRLAIMTWPFVPSPVDSTLFLRNVGSFVATLNACTTARQRDSVWNDVANTVPAGSIRLHPDSTSHQGFYPFFSGARVGTAIGPVVHPSGVHVFLVDSALVVKGASDTVYALRLIITEVEPSRETVDSTLAEVNTAFEMYEAGRILGDIATTFSRNIELSPYFGKDNKVYESYRLVDAAFEAQVTRMLDPVDSPERGAIIAVVIDSVPPGPLPFEAAKERVLTSWRIEQACKGREADMKKIRGIVTLLDDGRMFIGAPLTGATIFRDITVDPLGLIGDQILDPLASKSICATTTPGLLGPFRGDAGWYIVNIHYVVSPNKDDYPLYLQLNGEALAEEQRVDHWNSWQDHLADNARIEDFRHLYFRY